MKALIFNSGIGKRMGELTNGRHKSMVTLDNGETLFERQIRLLGENGISDFLITTGPYEEQFKLIASKYKNYRFTFVNNPVYDKTNYIYSFYLARNEINDDFIVLHGDLVFDNDYVKYVLNAPYPSTCSINKSKALPDKDFKGRIINGKLKEVSINIFDEDCFTFQPFYKLEKKVIQAWINQVIDFIENRNITGVYAENALNEISDSLDIIPISYENHYLEEIDNVDDYNRVRNDIKYFDYAEQRIYQDVNEVISYLNNHQIKKIFMVLDAFMLNSSLVNIIKDNFDVTLFSDYHPNPVYEEVVDALHRFKKNNCEAIISIGGGSAIDTAKALKLFLPLNEGELFLNQESIYINLKHIAIPTTAGTGSESTRFAVIYYEGKKQSLTNDMIVPDAVLLDKDLIKSVPTRQKVATFLDALCQASESIWSKNATEESVAYSKKAISLLVKNYEQYFLDNHEFDSFIQLAANYAGKAINISQTTAAHAFSYKITSMYGIPHGSAVALCMEHIWKHYLDNMEKLPDYQLINQNMSEAYGVDNIKDAYKTFMHILSSIPFNEEIIYHDMDLEILTKSVNPTRLKNYPIDLSEEDINNIYQKILKIKGE